MRAPPLCARSYSTSGTGGIYSSARGVLDAAHALSAGSRVLAAGVTWGRVIASAPWVGRYRHTSVIDAAGAIYVIGGQGSGPSFNYFYKEVYVSSNGGA